MTEPVYRYWGSREPQANYQGVRAEASTADNTAEIRLYDPIDSWGAPFGVSAKEFVTALDSLPEGTQAIALHINSPGGEVSEGIAILNALRGHDATVNVVVDGLAASAASFVAMAGDTVTMARNSQMMVHDASGFVIGNASDMADFAATLDKFSDNIASIYADRAGGSIEDWRAVMQAETWFSADEAVEAKLADRVEPKKALASVPENRFDLSIFAHAGREHAPAPFMPAIAASQAPAEPPVTPPNNTKEADTMSDTLIQGLRERFGLADDADEATVLAKADEVLDQATKPDPAPAPAADASIPEGKVLVSQNVLDELKDMAQAGVQARAKQLADERDEAIAAAFTEGKISAERRDAWSTAWDKDPEGTKADLASLPVRFPVAKVTGYQGDDGSTGGAAAFTDDEGDALGALAGLPKGALR